MFSWDLTEITRYKEEKCYTYDGEQIKWIDSFEMLKIFVILPLVSLAIGCQV